MPELLPDRAVATIFSSFVDELLAQHYVSKTLHDEDLVAVLDEVRKRAVHDGWAPGSQVLSAIDAWRTLHAAGTGVEAFGAGLRGWISEDQYDLLRAAGRNLDQVARIFTMLAIMANPAAFHGHIILLFREDTRPRLAKAGNDEIIALRHWTQVPRTGDKAFLGLRIGLRTVRSVCWGLETPLEQRLGRQCVGLVVT